MRRLLIRLASFSSLAIIVGAVSVVGLAIAMTASSGGGEPEQAGSSQRAGAALTAARKRAGVTLKLRKSSYGRVLFDGRRRALYLFAKDDRRSRCYGRCAEVWPPFIKRGKISVGPGLKRHWVDTVRRRNGKRQIRYRGHPLYFYVHDPRGVVGCHDVAEFGAKWLAVRKTGRPAPT